MDTLAAGAYVRSSVSGSGTHLGQAPMTISTTDEIAAIAEPFGLEVPLQEPLPTGPTEAATTHVLEDFAGEEPVYGHWSQPGPDNWTAQPHQGPLLPEEITNDTPPDAEIYQEAVGAFRGHLALAAFALIGLLAGVVVALVQ